MSLVFADLVQRFLLLALLELDSPEGDNSRITPNLGQKCATDPFQYGKKWTASTVQFTNCEL